MTSAIASVIEPLIESSDELIALEGVSSSWQEKIRSALVPNSDLPEYLLLPRSLGTLSKIIQAVDREEWRIMICGNGSKLNWGNLTKNIQLVVSTQNLNRIIEHAVGDLTVTVEAGTTLAQLQETLAKTNQFLPLDPSYPEEATIGGIVATADTGSWRQRYGSVRDLLIGLSFVRADGEIAKAGGRVVKNVAGYDLMKLFTGSYGSLGILSALTFRVYPLPETSKTLVITGDSNNLNAIANTIRNSGLTPTAADVISRSLVQKLELGDSLGLVIRFQSIFESVNKQVEQLQAIAQKINLQTKIFENTNEANLWQKLLGAMNLSSTLLDRRSTIISKVGLIPNATVDFCDRWQGLGLINISSGLGKLRIDFQNDCTHLKEMRSLAEQNKGFLTVLEAPTSVKQQLEPWGYRGNALEMMRKIKQNFDPKNLLNCNRFVV
jgi:glycolate oxidase FAD binding subunit